jgi:hypothetical protein
VVGRGITTVTANAVGETAVTEIHIAPAAGIMTVGTLAGEVVGRGITAVTTHTVGKAAVVKIHL